MAGATRATDSIVDSGHTILKCLKCRTPLVDIWLIQPERPLSSKIKARCWHCDGESSVAEIEGGINLGITDSSDIVDIEHLDSKHQGTTITEQNILVHTTQGG